MLEETAQKYFGDKIKFIGWHDNPWSIKYVNPVLVHFANAEGFPRVILEASMNGVPVLASKLPGYSDYEVFLDNVLFLNPREKKSILLADIFLKNVNSPQKSQDLLDNTFNQYIRLFSLV